MFMHFTHLQDRHGPGLIATGWTAVCCLLLIMFVTSIATMATFAFAIIELRWWNAPGAIGTPGPKRPEKERLRFHRLVTGLMFAVIVLFGAAVWRMFEFGRDSGVTTAYRSVHMTSGVSPLIPLIAMLGGFYWWFW